MHSPAPRAAFTSVCLRKTCALILLIYLGILGCGALDAAVPPERIHFPQEVAGFSPGWSVSPDKGELGILIPAATIPGDLPVPVAFRFNATFAQIHQPSWQLRYDFNTDQDYWQQSTAIFDRSILGTLHFGFILPQPNWFPDNSGPSGAVSTGAQVTYLGVLEDGRTYAALDFYTVMELSADLPAAFGLLREPTWVDVESTGTLAFYSTHAAGLNLWAQKVADLTSGRNFNGAAYNGPEGYRIVMDRDKARIFAFDYIANCWLPVLWLDRFGHWVSFRWTVGDTIPSGFQGAVRCLTVLNHRSVGFQLQTVSSSSLTEQPLARLDFIGIQAPSLLVAGYSGPAANRPAGVDGQPSVRPFPDTGPVMVRPTSVLIGNPAELPIPSWMAAGLPLPSPTGSAPWPANRSWTFHYVDSLNAELNDMTDPAGVKTTFTWGSRNLFSPGYDSTNLYRCVQSASSFDSRTGITRTARYEWSLPTTNSGTWTTTEEVSFGGSNVLPGMPYPNKIVRTFAPSNDANYCNGALTNLAVVNNGATRSNTVITLPSSSDKLYGLDQTQSFGWGDRGASRPKATIPTKTVTTYPAQDTPGLTVETILDSTTGLPWSTMTSSGSNSETRTYFYDPHPELLDPGRVVCVDYLRNGLSAPSHCTDYDSLTFLPTRTYLLDKNTDSRIGTSFSGYDSGGHLTKISNFASGSLFGQVDNTSTSLLTIDPTSGLQTGFEVSFTNPNSGATDVYSQAWSLSNYDSADRLLSVPDGMGVSTDASYDAFGRRTRIHRAGQPEIETTYLGEWQTESRQQTLQNPLVTTTTTDGFGHLMTRVRGVDGVTETYSLDSDGRIAQVIETPSSGASRTTTRTFDSLGRTKSLSLPGVPRATFDYSVFPAGSGDQVVNTNISLGNRNISSSRTLDMWGQVIVLSDPLSTVTKADFDAMGHATKVSVFRVTGAPQVRSFQFNGLGFLTSKQEPETGTQTFDGFESHGLPTTITENSGRKRTLSMDGLGRVRKVTGDLGQGDQQTFDYDGLKNATFTTTSSGQSTSIDYDYTDGCGRINVERVTPPSGDAWTQSYGFDAVGRLDHVIYPDTSRVSYHYDDTVNHGRVDKVTAASTGRTWSATVGVGGTCAYDGWGNLQVIAYGSGAQDQWIHSADGLRIQGHQISAPGASFPLRIYDSDERLRLKQAGEWSLTHDDLGRLTQAVFSPTTGLPLPGISAFTINIWTVLSSRSSVPVRSCRQFAEG